MIRDKHKIPNGKKHRRKVRDRIATDRAKKRGGRQKMKQEINSEIAFPPVAQW